MITTILTVFACVFLLGGFSIFVKPLFAAAIYRKAQEENLKALRNREDGDLS